MNQDPDSDPKRQRKHHRKSRSGCVTCKRRKIKCDEAKPVCVKCVDFRAPCGYAKPGEPVVLTDYRTAFDPKTPSQTTATTQDCSPPRRKPGRPRKIWTTDDIDAASGDTVDRWLCSQKGPSIPVLDTVPIPFTPFVQVPFSVTVPVPDTETDTIELLLHWTRNTAPTIAAFTEPGAPDLASFWAHEAPFLGLNTPYILHLILALSARHLLFLDTSSSTSDRHRRRIIALAARHTARGVAGLTIALAALDHHTAGPLYLASLLVCYCAFAAGPTGPDDLLVASATPLRPHTCMPLIRGVRLIREAFPPSVLFSGAFAALNRREEGEPEEGKTPWQPPWKALGAPRLCWERPLARLAALVNAHSDSEELGRSHAVRELMATYDTFYGRETDVSDLQTSSPAYRHVLRWLYVIDESFVASLQRGDDVSLLLLAHFAPLLQNHRDTWFLRGWAEQLVLAARARLSPWYMSWMRWPLEAAGLLWDDEASDHGGEGKGEAIGDREDAVEGDCCLSEMLAAYPSP